MRCVSPFVKSGQVYPCGHCLPCKFKARRIWFHRVLLEASQHDNNSVVTLTHGETEYPSSPILNPASLRDWLKRYCKRVYADSGRRLRFIACGEYGEKGGRPHYHVVLFGAAPCFQGRNSKCWCKDCGCVTCRALTETWPHGAVSVDRLSRESAAYVAGYVTRKVLAKSFGTRLSPFFRMSNGSRGMGGIGASAMHDVGSTVLQYNLPVPFALAHGRKPMLLGRYLRRKLSEYTAREITQRADKNMLDVLAYAFDHNTSATKVLREINEAYASQLEQREALREKIL